MEQRRGKLIFCASGGTAGHGGQTCKLTLPITWIREMGLDAAERNVELSFDGSSIRVTKHLPTDDFIRAKQAQGHSLLKLSYYDGDTLCTTIFADMTDHVIRIENHTDQILKTAFGNNSEPDWDDFQCFLEERCIPRARAGLRNYLDAIGVSEYDPLEIVQRTEGRMAEDDQWIKTEVLS